MDLPTPLSPSNFMQIAFDLPMLGNVALFDGVDLTRLSMLFALSGVFLLLVIVNGLFKYYINTYKGRLGERLLRRIRFTLVDHILRFPPATFKRLKGAEISSMVKDEVEPLGGFTGDAFVAPALLGRAGDDGAGLHLRAKRALGADHRGAGRGAGLHHPADAPAPAGAGPRTSVDRARAGRSGVEIVDGINTIHAYDTSNFERADISSRLGRIYKIRFDIYQWKFLVKFINNFLASVTPFLFYSVGGYLALHGRLDIGQLVAVIGAYKDLPGPLKELIDWDQNRQDVQIKYNQVIGQFAVDGMLPEGIQAVSGDAPAALAPPLAAVNLGVTDDSGGGRAGAVNFSLAPGETVAIIGNAGSGGDILAEALARIVWPTSGKITSGGSVLHDLPESVSGPLDHLCRQRRLFLFRHRARQPAVRAETCAADPARLYRRRCGDPRLEPARGRPCRQPRLRPEQRLDRLCRHRAGGRVRSDAGGAGGAGYRGADPRHARPCAAVQPDAVWPSRRSGRPDRRDASGPARRSGGAGSERADRAVRTRHL